MRLFAVTFMATSNNAALVEKAWQAAIRDHDPRVADLAERLRERREVRCGAEVGAKRKRLLARRGLGLVGRP